jgi:hypothetical protein
MAETYTTGILGAGGPLFGSAAGNMGSLAYTPITPSKTVARGAVDVPMDLAMFEGANKYENYVRAWPDLLAHYLNRMPEDTSSMAEWGSRHWQDIGSRETDEYMAAQGKTPMQAWRARGMWGDTPLSRTQMGPGRFQASKYLPAMAEAYDPRVGVTETTYSAGVPMPDVEGYKYEYPVYEWGGNDDPRYTYAGHTTSDIEEYPYYPSMPYGGEAARSKNNRILVNVRLVPK